VTAGAKHPGIPKPALENVDPLTARVYHAFGRVLHLNRLVTTKIISQQGFQPPEAFALTFLREHDGATQRELAGFLHLSPPRVSAILRTLEESGAVLRRQDEADRRLTRVFLTPEGIRRDQEQRAVLGEYVMRTLGALSETDRLEFERLLDALAEQTREVLSDPPQREGEQAG